MAGVEKSSVQDYPSFIYLLHKEEDGTFSAELGLDLNGFLFLALHRESYGLEGRVWSRCPEVQTIISKLFSKIVYPDPPLRSPIDFNNTSHRLKKLSGEQVRHLIAVLLNDRSVRLKACKGLSSYNHALDEFQPWVPPKEGEEKIEELVSLIDTPGLFLPGKRILDLMRWVTFCVQHNKEEGVWISRALDGGGLRKGASLIQAFVLKVVKASPGSKPFQGLIRELTRHHIPYLGPAHVSSELFLQRVIPIIASSAVRIRGVPLEDDGSPRSAGSPRD